MLWVAVRAEMALRLSVKITCLVNLVCEIKYMASRIAASSVVNTDKLSLSLKYPECPL